MNLNITDKTYKKLSIQVALNGMSFCVLDALSKQPLAIENIHFEQFQRNITIEELFENVFNDHAILNDSFDEITIIHNNNLSTFVPIALFDNDFIGSYLQYNTKVFETDFFTFDELPNYEMNNVYIPYVNMNNFFIDKFGSFDYKHSSSVLVTKLLDGTKNTEDRKMFVHVSNGHFEVIVAQNQKLLFYNSFDYKTPEDFIYFILFTSEQLQLNPESFKLELLGSISEEDPLFKITYKYIRHTQLFAYENEFNTLDLAMQRAHFILLNS
jgi:hypothetical protein